MIKKDLIYEENNREDSEFYENSQGIKCKNYDLCNSILPPDYYELNSNYLCYICGDKYYIGFGWNELEFKESSEECIICNKINKQVKFPTNCGHWFCIVCSKNILFWDETRYHLSPVPYGCPECPNGCSNPLKGKQCYCSKYDNIQKIWKHDNQVQYDKWRIDENKLILDAENEPGNIFGSKKCPLCRKVYYK